MIETQQISAGSIDKKGDALLYPAGGVESFGSQHAHAPNGCGPVRRECARNSPGSQAVEVSEQRVFHLCHADEWSIEGEQVLGLLLAQLRNRLKRKFPLADGEMVSDAVNDSFMAYWGNHQVDDPSLGMPEYFLFHASACNLSNLLRSEKRRKCREELFGKTILENSVELSSSTGNTLLEDPIQLLADEQKWHDRIKCLKNPLDREFVELWKNGELRVAAFAKILGVTRLALTMQKAAVKRAKDRLTKQLQRARAKFGWIV